MNGRSLLTVFVGSDLAPLRPLRMELRRRGARVEVALDEDQARARAEAPDLVVLDGAGDDEAPRLIRHFREAAPAARILHLQGPGDRSGASASVLSEFSGRLDDAPSWHPVPPPVLCVDDDAPFLASLGRLLHRSGYSVARCASPHEALDAIGRWCPRLAILDVLLPGMNGLDLALKIRKEHPERPSLAFLTALDSDEAQGRGLGLGADFYLRKPCDARRILEVVDYLAGDLDEPERELLRERLG